MCMSSDRGEQAESDTGGQLIDDDFAADLEKEMMEEEEEE